MAALRYIKNKIIIALYIICIAWGTLLVIDLASPTGDTSALTEYNNVSAELRLKSEPQNVLFSEAYITSDGEEIIKYAYAADAVAADDEEDLTRRTPDSQTKVLEVTQVGNKIEETLATTFYSKPQFYEVDGVWKQIEYATTTPEIFAMSGAIPHVKRREFVERLLPGNPVFAQTSTFYPNPDVETTSVDGSAIAIDSVSWASARNNSTGASADDSGVTLNIVAEYQFIGGPISLTIWSISRVFLLFDTSSLPDSAVISSATLSIYVTSVTNSDNDGDDTINLVTSTPNSNTVIIADDYDQLGTTLQASAIDITSISTSAYTGFDLNATGRGNISKTNISKFGIRGGHDLNNQEIAFSGINRVLASSAETSGTSQDPKLDVTYTTTSFSFGQWFTF